MDKISLRPIELADTDLIVKWRNNPFVIKNLFSQSLLTRESHIKYFNSHIKTGKCYQFIIEQSNKAGVFPIGTIFIKDIAKEFHRGEMGVFIGENRGRGQGFGKESVKQLLDFAFTRLHLHKVYLQVLEDNIIAIGMYKKLGFYKEGVMREHYYRDGRYLNTILMSILSDEYIKKYLK